MIFGDEQELPCHSAGQLLFWQKCVHEKFCFTLVNWETNLEKYGAFLYNDVCTHTALPERMKPMADTHIKYNDHSINSAFKNHYIVPDYQREYVWKDEQVEQLLADLLDAYNTDNQKAYFLGTIVTYDSGSQFELIDGQQRLTTFFILLCAIKKIYMDYGEQTSVIENLAFSVKISVPLENTGVSSVFTALDWPFSLIFSLARRNEGNFFQAVPTTLSSSLADVRLASLVAWA